MVLDSFFNWIFGPIINNLSPLLSMIIITFLITLIVTIIYKYLSNQSEIKTAKEETKIFQKELKKHKDNPQKMMELNQEIMKRSAVLMKNSFKPTLITFIPIIIIFGWLSKTFKDSGNMIQWGFSVPIFGTGWGWLGTYIVSSIIFSIILRKIMKVH